MDCSPPGSSVHGILQARILEWAAISFSLFRYNSPMTQFIYLKSICHRVTTTTINFRQMLSLPKETTSPSAVIPYFLHSLQSLTTTHLFSVSNHLPFLGISPKQKHALYCPFFHSLADDTWVVSNLGT